MIFPSLPCSKCGGVMEAISRPGLVGKTPNALQLSGLALFPQLLAHNGATMEDSEASEDGGATG